jgi:energy-coupling factor transporter transmembrane protein EcfT
MLFMKAVLPEPVHESYRRYRKQRTTQIILPTILGALLFLALVVLVIMGTANGGDVGRWAAISTIWISIPICLMGFVFLALTGGMVYLMGHLLGVAPTYTGKAQNFVHKLEIRIRRFADMTVKPVFAVNGFGATIKALLGRK